MFPGVRTPLRKYMDFRGILLLSWFDLCLFTTAFLGTSAVLCCALKHIVPQYLSYRVLGSWALQSQSQQDVQVVMCPPINAHLCLPRGLSLLPFMSCALASSFVALPADVQGVPFAGKMALLGRH